MQEDTTLKERYNCVTAHLNEHTRRLLAASEAMALGWGGSRRVARSTGMSRAAISHGMPALRGEAGPGPGRIRRPGGGRTPTVARDPTLRTDLEQLIDPLTRGDPTSPLRWTGKSQRNLAAELGALGPVTSSRMGQAFHLEWNYTFRPHSCC